MTALDQAFIKAYRQPGPAAKAAAAEPTRPVPLSEALGCPPRPSAGDAPAKGSTVSIDNVLKAFQETLTGRVDSAAPGANRRAGHNGLSAKNERPVPAATEAAGLSRTDGQLDPIRSAARPADVETAPGPCAVGAAATPAPAEAPAPVETLPAAPPPPAPVALHALPPPEIIALPAEPQANAADPEPARGPLKPLLQVDHFAWPKVCQRLDRTARYQLERMAEELVTVMNRGRKVVAMAGCARGAGTTTLLLCAARYLAERGVRVVVVDANLADPAIARRLGLLPDVGWEEVLAGRLPLEEVLIEAIANGVTVLPLREPFAGTGDPAKDEARMAENIETLTACYDMVLVDLGPLDDRATVGGALARGIGRRLDAIVLVHNVRATAEDCLVEVQQSLAAAGIEQVGIIQNFVAA